MLISVTRLTFSRRAVSLWLPPQDYLTSVITLLDAGDEALNAVLGAGGQEWRQKYVKDGSALYKNTKNVLDALDFMRGK